MTLAATGGSAAGPKCDRGARGRKGGGRAGMLGGDPVRLARPEAPAMSPVAPSVLDRPAPPRRRADPAAPPARLMTAEEFHTFVNLPENADRSFELDEGKVVEMPRPKEAHGLVCGNVYAELRAYARRTGVGQVFANDTGIQLAHDPDTVRGPDIMYRIRKRELAELIERGAAPGWETDPPDVAAEVRSPHDRPGEIDRKVAQYLAAGVRRVWVIDPAARTLTVHAPGEAPRTLREGGELSEPADGVPAGFALAVADLFTA